MKGFSLAYEVRGTGFPVVFLHAFPLNRRMWDDVVSRLEGVRAVLVDAPGFGESPSPGRAYDLADVARGVLALLDGEGIRTFGVVGLSMGGYVAFRLWDEAWPRIRGMVLANTRAEMDGPEAREARDQAIARIVRGDREGFLRDLVVRLVGATTRARRPEVVDRVRSLAFQASEDALVRALEAMRDRPDSVPLLPTVEVPVLAVAGAEDEVTPPEGMEAMVRRMPRATLVRMAGVGHLSAMEDPETFARYLQDFVRTLPSP